jgi:hypothetical protein
MNLKSCAHKNLTKTQICGECEPPQGWQHYAQCTLDDPDLLYPDETDLAGVRKAKWICSNCPVKGFCLELGWADDWGIWAGFTISERKRLRKVFNMKDKTIQERRLAIRTIAHRL